MRLRALLHDAVKQAWREEAEYEPETLNLLHARVVQATEQSADRRADRIDDRHDPPRQDKLFLPISCCRGGRVPVAELVPVPMLVRVPVPVLVLAVAAAIAVRGVAVAVANVVVVLRHAWRLVFRPE